MRKLVLLGIIFTLLLASCSKNLNPSIMVKYSEKEIVQLILKEYDKKAVSILAPIVKGRKGHYAELFRSIIKQGFLKARVDGEIIEIDRNTKLDRYKTHADSKTIETMNALNKVFDSILKIGWFKEWTEGAIDWLYH